LVRIDHVIYATADLDAASARVEAELGLTALAGGRHQGLGTHNRIVPLGGGYLELLAVVDPEEAAGSALGAAVQARIAREGDGLFGWAVAVADVKPVAARLRTPISTIRRGELSANLTGLLEAMREPFPPFFISRDPGAPDPGAGGHAGGVTWIEVSGDATSLAHWLGGVDLPVRVVPGAPGVRAVGIGERRFGRR
jgi:catechol 2,3-dioxygenase-like lactoylglutathione lyase family enzyme